MKLGKLDNVIPQPPHDMGLAYDLLGIILNAQRDGKALSNSALSAAAIWLCWPRNQEELRLPKMSASEGEYSIIAIGNIFFNKLLRSGVAPGEIVEAGSESIKLLVEQFIPKAPEVEAREAFLGGNK
jgi:hypothetical protein